VPRPARLLTLVSAGALALLVGCGGEIEVPEDQQAARQGAQLFYERCSGCHTLDAANSFGSKPEGQLAGGERTNGPNFNIRRENRNDVLYAIRNGGFSGAIMPANIVTGEDAEKVATFLEEYAGKAGKDPVQATGGESNTGSGTRSGE
jgi:mono/diheme cytochrome c family protein